MRARRSITTGRGGRLAGRSAWSAAVGAIGLLLAVPALAQSAGSGAAEPAAGPQGSDAQELAKKLSNPISDLVSLPFRANWDQGVGPEHGTRFTLNIQPVVPFELTPKLNLIARVIMPFLGQPPLVPGGEAASGLSDVLASAFFSPSQSKEVTWGAGPVLSLPTTTDPFLGSGQ